tara:strand:- start:20252 stop:20851 length:600 start_codon:yes stop_codon:yes gene_type:complete
MAGLRDNPEAIANGNAGAAADIYIETAGIRDAAVTSGEGGKIEEAISNNTDGSTSSTVSGVAVAIATIFGNRNAQNTYDASSGRVYITRKGTYTILGQASGSLGLIECRTSIRVNGIQVATTAAANPGPVYYQHVAALEVGDYIDVKCVSTNGAAAGGGVVSRFTLYMDNPLLDVRPTVFPLTTYTATTIWSTAPALWS